MSAVKAGFKRATGADATFPAGASAAEARQPLRLRPHVGHEREQHLPVRANSLRHSRGVRVRT